MSENESERDDAAVAPQTNPGPRVDSVTDDAEAPGRASPGPPVVPESDEASDDDASDDDRDESTTDPAGERAIPGEAPEDNPDLEGEDRFDAG